MRSLPSLTHRPRSQGPTQSRRCDKVEPISTLLKAASVARLADVMSKICCRRLKIATIALRVREALVC